MPRSRMPRDEIPDRPPGLRVEPRRQLVEEHELGLVDQRERDEEPLLLAARQRHEPGVALGVESEPREQRVGVDDARVERRPEVDGLPDLDPLLELGLLMLHADALPQRGGVAARVETEHGDGAAVG